MDNRPRGREKHVTNNGKGVSKRGSGLGTGPVGTGSGRGSSSGGYSGGGPKRSSGGGRSPFSLIILLIVFLLGGGGGAMSMLGGGSSSSGGGLGGMSDLFGGPSGGGSAYESIYNNQVSSSSWNSSGNSGALNTSVASGSRAKYTEIKGNGKDKTTIMVYMCGTDLESRSGMASNDLKEMAKATTGNNINLIIYTGGCAQWKINGISNRTNEIFQIKDGQMYVLEKDMGNKCMTTPSTLTEFIKYCKKNFPANRNDLILWDHGGGSVSGYGYDEKNPRSGAMNLTGIRKALSDADMKFDFIGYDACLMATAENALMLDEFADYLIASEETEPGIGWYYTDWLTAYSKNPSMDTLSIGKNIIDGFVTECAKSCRGQLTTLSIIDLAEFANTVPDELKAFSKETMKMIEEKNYQTVANARTSSREFAQSTKIDQVDLVDLANKIGTQSSKTLAKTLLSAIKYNRTSSNMTNAYGVSIYFPNKKLSSVNNALSINEALGMDEDFNQCIREYASLEASGQTVATGMGNSGNPYSSLFGSLGTAGSSSSSSSHGSQGTAGSDLTSQLLQALLTQGINSLSGMDSGSTSFFTGRSLSLSDDMIIDYIAENQFDASELEWKERDGKHVISMSEEQWSKITDLELNVFVDDGEGFIDLGLDNVFEFDDKGNLIGDTDETWLAINGQPVAYYHTSTMEDGDNYTITGYVPAMLNGNRVKLLLTFDQDNPYGFIAGVETDYKNGETDTVAKADVELEEGDTLEFLCDYYSYEGEYEDSYFLGDPMVVTEKMEISNVSIADSDLSITYKFTDIYDQDYWTPVLPEE